MRGRQLIFVFMIVAAIAIAGCTRSATTNPTALPVVSESPEAPQETAEVSEQGDTPSEMQTALAGGFATQTASAEAAAGGEQPEATEPPEQEEPEASEAPEAAEEPTKTPKPTDEPDESAREACKSPYTVKKGEWVWSIGRKCNIDPNSIIRENNLVYPYTIFPGQRLVFPNNPPPFKGP